MIKSWHAGTRVRQNTKKQLRSVGLDCGNLGAGRLRGVTAIVQAATAFDAPRSSSLSALSKERQLAVQLHEQRMAFEERAIITYRETVSEMLALPSSPPTIWP